MDVRSRWNVKVYYYSREKILRSVNVLHNECSSAKSFDARWCSRSRNLNTKRRGKSARWRQAFPIVSIVTVTRHDQQLDDNETIEQCTPKSNRHFHDQSEISPRSGVATKGKISIETTRVSSSRRRNLPLPSNPSFRNWRLRVDESIISTISLPAFDMLILFRLKVTFCSFVGPVESFQLLPILIFESRIDIW